MLMEGDASGVISAATKSHFAATSLAEVICYYLQWDVRKPVSFKSALPALLS
jgi:hypothetical protein